MISINTSYNLAVRIICGAIFAIVLLATIAINLFDWEVAIFSSSCILQLLLHLFFICLVQSIVVLFFYLGCKKGYSNLDYSQSENKYCQLIMYGLFWNLFFWISADFGILLTSLTIVLLKKINMIFGEITPFILLKAYKAIPFIFFVSGLYLSRFLLSKYLLPIILTFHRKHNRNEAGQLVEFLTVTKVVSPSFRDR